MTRKIMAYPVAVVAVEGEQEDAAGVGVEEQGEDHLFDQDLQASSEKIGYPTNAGQTNICNIIELNMLMQRRTIVLTATAKPRMMAGIRGMATAASVSTAAA